MFIVLADCGDYYCEGTHVVGVYSTRELADQAKQKAEKQRIRYRKGVLYKRYFSAIVDEVELDKIPKDVVDR